MKPIRTLSFLFLSSSILFTACQKSVDEPTQTCVITKVSTDDQADGKSVTLYAYDSQLRVIKETDIDPQNNNDTIYIRQIIYGTNQFTVIEGEVGSADYVNDTTIYTISNGRVTSAVSRNPGGTFSTKHTSNISFTYNADGYITKVVTNTHYPDSGDDAVYTQLHEYQNGNVVLTKYEGSDLATTYEYYEDKPNSISFLANGSYQQFLEPHVKNLLKRSNDQHIAIIGNDSQVVTDIEDYTYTFNSDGLVKDFKVIGNNTSDYTTVLDYKCE